jgi:hypothetical protein
MKLFEGFKTTVLLLLTFPVWLPILLWLFLITSIRGFKIDPDEMTAYSELDFNEIDNYDEDEERSH